MDRVRRLVTLIQDLSRARTLESVQAIVRSGARELTGADGATFVLRDGNQCFYADEDAIAPLWKGSRFPMSACISGWTMLNRQSVVIEDIYVDPRIPADAYRPTFVKSLAMVPIRTADPIGAIGNYWATNRRPTNDEVELLQALADATSIALENVALYADLRGRIDELGRRRVELEEANRALAERQEKLDILMRGLPALVWTTDLQLRHTSVAGSNRTLAIETNNFVGNRAGFLVDDVEQREKFVASHKAALTGAPAGFEVQVRGRWLQGHIEGLRDARNELVGTIGVCLDVTATRDLQQQLVHAQKMDAVGQLAGGIAHDFNNILTAVLSFAKFVLGDLEPAHPSRPDVEEVIRAGERAAALTRQLLAFSRKQVYEPQPLDLNEILVKLEKMLRRILGEDVELATVLGPQLGQVHADRAHLEQVILNLAVNARDAMPHGGRLTLETANVDLDGKHLLGHLQAPAGPYVMVAVTDTGVGIPEEARKRIFEPFFTTKPAGKGTGLGLATVYGIVKQVGGDLSVYSAVGHGTTFKVYLPCLLEAGVAAAPRPATPRQAVGHEHVLLVEDDPSVRAAARRALANAGYRVTEADSAAAALGLLATREVVDLVLTDVIMPEMSGRELVEALRKRGDAPRVLFMSGYTGGALVHQGVFASGTPYLQKPFTPEQLADKVRAVLDAPVPEPVQRSEA